MILVYPGSFDPVTNGHLDIIERAACICDKLIVAVGNNESKKPAFTVEERIELIRAAIGEREDIVVTSFTGLLADFAKKVGARAVIKGLRAMSDFEYEFQMALLNKKLEPDLETLFMMTSVQYSFLSSSAVKEIARNGGNIDGLVPDGIKDRIIMKLTCR
ncbi:MAG: pantetheine-phosphate adenylyltransferase [Clostridiaceae bacterium]|jgi:pantetheine-phosphate adenylyltransferase|nr:pantetheine-phosphate adenylyltransferase [Clostridiaceae bacterium]